MNQYKLLTHAVLVREWHPDLVLHHTHPVVEVLDPELTGRLTHHGRQVAELRADHTSEVREYTSFIFIS